MLSIIKTTQICIVVAGPPGSGFGSAAWRVHYPCRVPVPVHLFPANSLGHKSIAQVGPGYGEPSQAKPSCWPFRPALSPSPTCHLACWTHVGHKKGVEPVEANGSCSSRPDLDAREVMSRRVKCRPEQIGVPEVHSWLKQTADDKNTRV